MKINHRGAILHALILFLHVRDYILKRKYLMNLMESLPRRLQAITNGKGNHRQS
jgi:hypothetical protein